MINSNDDNKIKYEQELEKLKVDREEAKLEKDKQGTKYAKVQKEHDKLKAEVETLKTNFNGSDDEYKEYLKELATFDRFKFLREKNGTTLTQRAIQINLGGTVGKII